MAGEDAETARAKRLLNSPAPIWRKAAQAYLDGRYSHICVPYDLGGSCTQPHPATPLMAAPRDASVYNCPGYAGKIHVAIIEPSVSVFNDRGIWFASCRKQTLLAEFAGRHAKDVPAHQRCQRPGCRERWPS